MADYNLDEIKRVPIKEVAARLGIKHLRGNKAMCFGGHDTRTPSLSFVPAKNIWKCFGCGRKGDAIELVMSVRECDFKAALAWFATEFQVSVTNILSRRRFGPSAYPTRKRRVAPKALKAALEKDLEFSSDPELYGWFMDRCGAVSETVGLDYLANHGIPTDVAFRFGVRELRDPRRAWRRLIARWGAERVFRSGLAWGDGGNPQRLIWTSYTVLFSFYINGTVGYIQGRLFKGEPKYLNPRGIAKPLYNIDRLHSLPAGSIVHICEGVPDALALEAHGLPAVAVLGASSFRQEWVEDFMPYDIVLMPDGDSGGETFRRAISEFFKARGKAVRAVNMPIGKDVADVIGEIRGTM
jgi:hypothetical protein